AGGIVVVEAFGSKLRLLVTDTIVAIPDHTDRSHCLGLVDAKDDAPISISNGELSPANEITAERLTGLRALGLYLEELLEEQLELAALRMLGQIRDRIVYELDTAGHLG
ncbi:MAG TPA: hypothetical protein VNL97_04170, partial [Solirubrobacterales bacterium]|nr:hypothetical protein [Solirubrobacterales bacterium]